MMLYNCITTGENKQYDKNSGIDLTSGGNEVTTNQACPQKKEKKSIYYYTEKENFRDYTLLQIKQNKLK